jgi:putative flippase GtrA
MPRASPYDSLRATLTAVWRKWAFSRKALTFATIGVINTAVDYCVFLIARAALLHSAIAHAEIGSLSDFCRCGDPMSFTLVVSNLISWSVAVTGSYVMNSSVTFAAESGGKLRWSAYLAFVASGILGWLANTTVLLIGAELLLLPIWLAKAVAILAGFVLNFSLSHFVVFRVRAAPSDSGKAV